MEHHMVALTEEIFIILPRAGFDRRIHRRLGVVYAEVEEIQEMMPIPAPQLPVQGGQGAHAPTGTGTSRSSRSCRCTRSRRSQDMARGDRACAKERTFFRMISLDEGEIQAGAPAAGRCRQYRRDGNSSTPLPTRIMHVLSRLELTAYFV